MKKNTRLIIITAVLLLAAALVLTNNSGSAFNPSESQFAIDDTASVTRFFLADKQGNQVLVSRDSLRGGWLINREHRAHPLIVSSFLKVASQLAVESPVASKASPNVMKAMAANGTKVEFYQMKPLIDWFGLNLFVSERLTRTYYVGEVTSDNTGTYMLMEGSSQPFVVYQPGFRGFVQARYFTTASDWRDHTIFASALEQIQSVEMTYPSEPVSSFTIVNNGNRTLTLKTGATMEQTAPFDTLRCLAYLTAFHSVKFEAFINDIPQPKLDSITGSTPLFELTLTLTDGRKETMKAWHMETGEPNTELYGHTFNMDRMYGMVGNGDFVMLQYFVFDKFLMKAQDFNIATKTGL